MYTTRPFFFGGGSSKLPPGKEIPGRIASNENGDSAIVDSFSVHGGKFL